MAQTVQEATRFEESHYLKGFQRDTNKLAGEINDTYIHLASGKLGIEGYAKHYNITPLIPLSKSSKISIQKHF